MQLLNESDRNVNINIFDMKSFLIDEEHIK